jgi:hypothetical protein
MVPKVRTARFAQHLMDLVRADPQPTGAWTFQECGYTACPFGIVLGLPTRAFVYWQGVATARPGESYDDPEQPAHGPPPAALTMPTLPQAGLTQMIQVEGYVGALLTAAQGEGELRAVELYANREKPGSVPYGMNLRWHNGASIYLYARHCIPAGQQYRDGETAFRRRDVI